MEQIPARILVVDDEKDMLETCRKVLSLHRYQVEVADQAPEAVQLFREHRHDLVIADLKMPGMSGLDLMKEIHSLDEHQLVLLITAYGTVENAMEAVRAGAFDFVRKPFKMDDLLIVVERALRFKALQDDNQRLQQKLQECFCTDRIVGTSPDLQAAFQKLRKVSEVDVSVLIVGETGTGKELFARTIHENSRRRAKPFMVIDCVTLPETLLESELFGYEKGAFTGAVQNKAGLFEIASGGTLLLDEIAELPPNLQAKLLRVLQEGTIRRLGDAQERRVDVRVLAATNRDVDAMLRSGRFREDLFYRINVVRIEVPPLRERQTDIPLLANHFFSRFRSQVPRTIEGISAAAMLILTEYDWPGNVRELRNAIERACTLTESTQIVPQDLPPDILSAVEEEKSAMGTSHFLEAKGAVVEDFEKKYLIEMLSRTGGNVTEAARFSGLSRPAFHRLMSRHAIASSDFKESGAKNTVPAANHKPSSR